MQTLTNQLIYFAFLQGVFLLFIYLFSSGSRKTMNGYVLVLISVLLLGLIGKILNMTIIFGTSHRYAALSEFSIYLFGPTIYLFTQSSLNKRAYRRKDIIHYFPAIAYSIVLTFYFIIPTQEVIVAKVRSGELFLAVLIFMGVGLLFNFFYWFLSYRSFKSFQRRLKDEASFVVKTFFFKRFLMAVGFCLVIWMGVFLIGALGQSWLEREARPLIWLGLSFIILFISYYSIKSPELFRVASLINTQRTKYAQSKYSVGELEGLKKRLDLLMKDKKPYLNRSLMKADLAELLGVNKPDIARLLNEQIGMNFFEYVNFFRIQEFIELAKTEKANQLTFFGLAQETGFNSKTTFNKSFKKLMGSSPKDYFARELS